MHIQTHTTWAKVIAGIFVTLAVFGAGALIGFNTGANQVGASEKVDMSSFWKVWDLVDEKYVAATGTKISDEERVYGAIKGMLESLGDPYTTFLPPAELKSFEEDISGNFEGVGMEVDMRDGILTVVAPLKGTPAEKAGVKAGDKILKINDTSTEKLSVDEAIKLIRGKAGTVVKLSLLRDGKALEISITRAVIKVPAIETEMKEGVFIIKISSFSAISATQFKSALREFALAKTDKLVIDVRNNPGGYLEAAVDIASWFLPAGKIIVTEDFGPNEEPEYFRSKGYDVFSKKIKVVVLVNGGSASASEIVAGALREHGVATLVGEKTFGKGSVQELVPITSDTSIKVTIARWLTPLGNSISLTGITPDVEVELSEEDFKANRDPQMDKAIEILKKK